MVFKKIQDENGGKWILKRKFTFAAVVLLVITVFAGKGFVLATTAADITVLLTAYATASGIILTLIFGADVADKKLNGGSYQPLNREPYYEPRQL